MPKLKIFLWKLCHASLPTRGTLLNRRLDIDPICPHYNIDIGDEEHLFLGCSITQHVRKLAFDHNWIAMNLPINHTISIQQWLANLRRTDPCLKMDRVVALLWSIWKTRNNKVFRKFKSSNHSFESKKSKC